MVTLTTTEVEHSEVLPRKRTSGETVNNPDGPPQSTSSLRTEGRMLGEVTDAVIHERPDPDASPEESQYPTGRKFWLLMFSLGAAIALSAIDMSIVATAVPKITDHFHTVADVGWYSVAFRLCQCAFQFIYGKAYKLFSVKRVFMIANIFSVLGSLLCATADSSTMLVVGRAVAGIGTAGLGSGAFIMLVQSTPLRRRPMFTGLWAAIEGTSTIAGPLLGGAITQTIGWRWCFWINLPIGAATLMSILLCFSEAPKASDVANLTFKQKFKQLDVISNLLLIPALTCLFLAFSWAGTKYAWSSARVLSLILTFCVLSGAFIYNQFRQGDAATLPIRVMNRRSVIASLVFVTFFNSAGNVLEYYLPIYYQAVRGYTPAQSGYLMLPILIAATLGAVGAGIGTSVIGYYAPCMIFAAVTMPIAAGLITTLKIDTGLAKIIAYTAFSGLGYGVGSSGPTTAIQTVLSDTDLPLGMSALMFGSAFGPAATIAIAQVIFTNQLSENLRGVFPGSGQGIIESNGITELVNKVPKARAKEVLMGIDKSITQTWYLVVALACAMAFGSLPTEWRSVKKESPNREAGGSGEGLELDELQGS